MTSRILRLRHCRSDRGASAVEYGLVLAAVAAVIMVSVFAFGGMVQNIFTRTTYCIQDAGNGAPYPNCPTPP